MGYGRSSLAESPQANPRPSPLDEETLETAANGGLMDLYATSSLPDTCPPRDKDATGMLTGLFHQ